MRPQKLKTKVFLDSGDPKETNEALKLLGFLDGQTTNPTLVSKNPQVKNLIKQKGKLEKDELLSFYKNVVTEISSFIPDGSISIEVYADKNTSSDQMYEQGKEMFTWIPNAHIKLPIVHNGLKAAEKAAKNGIRINMTLCFSQEQAAAVYSATKIDSQKDSLSGFRNVFVSPFIGRLDDKGENGMTIIENILNMYKEGDNHVETLTASVRSLNHFFAALSLGTDIITCPLKILREWKESDFKIPAEDFVYNPDLKPIEYKKLNLDENWEKFNITHDLTDAGLDKFSNDWNDLIS